jgi:hypothetical protein
MAKWKVREDTGYYPSFALENEEYSPGQLHGIYISPFKKISDDEEDEDDLQCESVISIGLSFQNQFKSRNVEAILAQQKFIGHLCETYEIKPVRSVSNETFVIFRFDKSSISIVTAILDHISNQIEPIEKDILDFLKNKACDYCGVKPDYATQALKRIKVLIDELIEEPSKENNTLEVISSEIYQASHIEYNKTIFLETIDLLVASNKVGSAIWLLEKHHETGILTPREYARLGLLLSIKLSNNDRGSNTLHQRIIAHSLRGLSPIRNHPNSDHIQVARDALKKTFAFLMDSDVEAEKLMIFFQPYFEVYENCSFTRSKEQLALQNISQVKIPSFSEESIAQLIYSYIIQRKQLCDLKMATSQKHSLTMF